MNPVMRTMPIRASLVAAVGALLVVLASAGPVQAQALVAVPPLTARVTDEAGLLTPDQRAALEASLADYEKQKGSQIAVLTVPTTAPEQIEQYGIRVADAWKIGRKGTADGVIVIVARDNPSDLRRLRIEVGRGVEGSITDAQSKRIIDEEIAPRFRQGDFAGGLAAGVGRIESLLQGESLPPPPARPVDPARSSGFGLGLPGLFLLFVVVSFLLRGVGSRRVGYLSGNRALNQSITPFVVGGILGSLGNRGGGGFGGGGFGGGGGDGGGFSGGGGDFGGGGASGNW